jgi:hypothetical protein
MASVSATQHAAPDYAEFTLVSARIQHRGISMPASERGASAQVNASPGSTQEALAPLYV